MLNLDSSGGFCCCKNLTFEIRDRKGSENVVADHLSRLIVDFNEDIVPITETFPDEQLMHISQIPTPWFVDIVNYLVTTQIPSHWTKQDRSKLLAKVKHFFWDDPYLFKYYPDQIIRRCIPKSEHKNILSFYHNHACGGHFSSKKTVAKILQSGFYWPSIFHDAHAYYLACERCQKLGSIGRRNMMSLNPILIVELFDVWGIDFMGKVSFYHNHACGGHFSSKKIAAKILQSGFYWPSIFHDAHAYCLACERCQKLGSIGRKNMMPLNLILIVELLDVWGIDFMGPYPNFHGTLP
jgi:hypothetical protein